MMKTLLKQFIGWSTIVAFLCGSVVPSYAQAVAGQFDLPAPGSMITVSPAFVPAMLKGLRVDVKEPFKFDFILDTGNTHDKPEALKAQANKLIRYFLAALTIPEEDQWVNLSPYEKDRIIADEFSLTEMGRDMLAEDYILKQITASLIYPESDIGRVLWKKVYARAFELYGTTDIPTDVFNKVWITPDKAVVYENGANVFVTRATMKVMLEADYLATERGVATEMTQPQAMSRDILREVVIPVLEQEVNEGENFVQLRQIYSALILAKWYKDVLKDSILTRKYANQRKVGGVDLVSADEKQDIYWKYVEAFRKGAFNYIKEEYDEYSQETVPRKYFAGGVVWTHLNVEPTATLADIAVTTPQARAVEMIGDFRPQGQPDLSPQGQSEKIDMKEAKGDLQRVFITSLPGLWSASVLGNILKKTGSAASTAPVQTVSEQKEQVENAQTVQKPDHAQTVKPGDMKRSWRERARTAMTSSFEALPFVSLGTTVSSIIKPDSTLSWLLGIATVITTAVYFIADRQYPEFERGEPLLFPGDLKDAGKLRELLKGEHPANGIILEKLGIGADQLDGVSAEELRQAFNEIIQTPNFASEFEKRKPYRSLWEKDRYVVEFEKNSGMNELWYKGRDSRSELTESEYTTLNRGLLEIFYPDTVKTNYHRNFRGGVVADLVHKSTVLPRVLWVMALGFLSYSAGDIFLKASEMPAPLSLIESLKMYGAMAGMISFAAFMEVHLFEFTGALVKLPYYLMPRAVKNLFGGGKGPHTVSSADSVSSSESYEKKESSYRFKLLTAAPAIEEFFYRGVFLNSWMFIAPHLFGLNYGFSVALSAVVSGLYFWTAHWPRTADRFGSGLGYAGAYLGLQHFLGPGVSSMIGALFFPMIGHLVVNRNSVGASHMVTENESDKPATVGVQEPGNVDKPQQAPVPIRKADVVTETTPDHAQPPTSVKTMKADDVNGGIDFNTDRLNLERQGKGVSFDWAADPSKTFEIRGLAPVILQITPVSDLQALMRSTK